MPPKSASRRVNASPRQIKEEMIRRGSAATRRHTIAKTRGDETKIRRARKRQLVAAGDRCADERRATTAGCAKRRDKIRAAARRGLALQKKRRHDAREKHADTMGRHGRRATRPKALRYSRAESDSLAEHNIPADLRGAWRERKAGYSYRKEPDMRAEQFMEWVEATPEEVIEIQIAAAEIPDANWAAMEANSYAERQEAAVPF